MWVATAKKQHRRRRKIFGSAQHWIPLRGWGEGWLQRQLARAGAALIERGHLHAPVAGGCGAVGCGHLDLHELFCFGKGGWGNLGPDRWSGPEGCWRPGRCGWILIHGGLPACWEGCADQSGSAPGEEFTTRFWHFDPSGNRRLKLLQADSRNNTNRRWGGGSGSACEGLSSGLNRLLKNLKYWSKLKGKHPSGAKAPTISLAFAARLKS